MHTLIQANTDALNQAAQLLQGLSDQFYRQKKLGSASGVGSHVRHIVDHYISLRTGIKSNLVDYNLRRRQCAAETDRRQALKEISDLITWLREDHFALEDGDQFNDRTLNICTEVCFRTSANMTLQSTLSRELCYLLNHTVHHVAYISLLCKQAGYSVDSTVGVAPATLSAQQPVERPSMPLSAG